MIAISTKMICITFSEINLSFMGKLNWEIRSAALTRGSEVSFFLSVM